MASAFQRTHTNTSGDECGINNGQKDGAQDWERRYHTWFPGNGGVEESMPVEKNDLVDKIMQACKRYEGKNPKKVAEWWLKLLLSGVDTPLKDNEEQKTINK